MHSSCLPRKLGERAGSWVEATSNNNCLLSREPRRVEPYPALRDGETQEEQLLTERSGRGNRDIVPLVLAAAPQTLAELPSTTRFARVLGSARTFSKRSLIILYSNGGRIAQLVEQLPLKQTVGGSNPSAPTI